MMQKISCKDKQEMDQVRDRGKKEKNMKEEITIEESVIQEVLGELIDITHLLIQQGNSMRLKTP
jgi:hypothetical protein